VSLAVAFLRAFPTRTAAQLRDPLDRQPGELPNAAVSEPRLYGLPYRLVALEAQPFVAQRSSDSPRRVSLLETAPSHGKR
jgi:hypothetical protein